jgi:GDP-L-fucose synthase
MNLNSRIYVAGHRGLVGSAVVRLLREKGYNNIITKSHDELDLTNQAAVNNFFAENLLDIVVMAAGKVGGIRANNTYPAEFIYANLAIASNTIHAAYKNNVRRFLFLGSSCIYPKHAEQPMREDCLLSSSLEPTNEAYAIAKIAGLKLCQYYRKQYGVMFHSLMPTNLYGIGDNYHPENSHVLPALIRRFHEAKINNSPTVTAWGTGSASREFLCADDLAEAILTSLSIKDPLDWINVGYGSDVTIKELTEIVARVIEYKGTIIWDKTKPDGTPRKLLDSSEIFKTGWKPKINLEEGIKLAYNDFIQERYERKY